MGEEEKKPEEQKVEEKKQEEVKKPEEPKQEEKEPPKDEEKKEEKKTENPPPPQPQDIILRVYMHCEGCARKVRRCLKSFQGVESVETDCKTHKVVVKGEKADPLKVLERIQKKSHSQVELLSPIPKPKVEEPAKPEEKAQPKPEEKKEEPQVIIVVLKVHMHCDACAQEIKKRIQRMNGVESADPDLKNSEVTVKGVFDSSQLVEYVHKRTGKRVVIVKQEPEKKEEEKGKDGKEEKKVEENKKVEEEKVEVKKEEAKLPESAAAEQEEKKVVEMKNEFYYAYPQNFQIYPPSYPAEMYVSYPPPPQMFSDENPNACSIM